jgi:ribosome-associated protein
MSLAVTPRITIPDAELEERFIRSSGPGGQNVNKVSSAVQLRFNVAASASLTEAARQALLDGGKLTRDGVLVITAQRFREQERNRADARARLVEIIRRAATPRKARRATRVPKASKRKRLDSKKHRADIKRGRSRPD